MNYLSLLMRKQQDDPYIFKAPDKTWIDVRSAILAPYYAFTSYPEIMRGRHAGGEPAFDDLADGLVNLPSSIIREAVTYVGDQVKKIMPAFPWWIGPVVIGTGLVASGLYAAPFVIRQVMKSKRATGDESETTKETTMIIRAARGMRGMGDNGNGAHLREEGGPWSTSPWVATGRTPVCSPGRRFPPLTTLEPRDVTQYPDYSYLRMNQWDGQYQPNTTEGSPLVPGTTSSSPAWGAMSTRGLLSSSKRRTFGGMGATGVPGPPYSKAIFSDKGNRFTRIVGDTQFPSSTSRRRTASPAWAAWGSPYWTP